MATSESVLTGAATPIYFLNLVQAAANARWSALFSTFAAIPFAAHGDVNHRSIA
jgi:hypothetical protein